MFPAGQATFRVSALSSGGASYTSVIWPATTFTATAASSSSSRTRGRRSGGSSRSTRVRRSDHRHTRGDLPRRPDAGVGRDWAGQADGDGVDTVRARRTLQPGAPPPDPGVPPPPSSPEVRIDICAPLPNLTTCSTTTVDQSFGVLFTGSLGDPFTSHLTSGSTPAIYFYPGTATKHKRGVHARAADRYAAGRAAVDRRRDQPDASQHRQRHHQPRPVRFRAVYQHRQFSAATWRNHSVTADFTRTLTAKALESQVILDFANCLKAEQSTQRLV